MAKVTIYTTPTCTFCSMAKAFFKQNNVQYLEHNVAVDHAKAQEMIQKSGQTGVPVIEIDGQLIVGFNKPKIAEALGLTA